MGEVSKKQKLQCSLESSIICTAVILLSLLHQFSAEIALTPSYTSVHRYICPGPVIFTCVGSHTSTSLYWEVNGTTIATYAFRSSDSFPLTLTIVPLFGQNGVEAEVIDAVTTSADMSNIYITSELRVNDVSVLNSSSVRCTESVLQSNIVHIMVSSKAIPPPPFPITAFSSYSSNLVFSRAWGPIFHLRWSPSFTSQHAVERYNVSVDPDPNSCSSDQVISNRDYNCSGFVLGTCYHFKISAINCRNQEGERRRLNFVIHDPLALETCLFEVTPIYSSLSSTITEIQVNWERNLIEVNDVQCSDLFLIPSSIRIHLDDSSGRHVQQQFTDRAANCNDTTSICSTSFFISNSEDGYYAVYFSVTDTLGKSMFAYYHPKQIAGTSMDLLNYTLTLTDDIVFALCSSLRQDIKNCSIQYTLDPYYRNLSSPVTGPINTPFPIITIIRIDSTMYYHQATVITNTSAKVILRSSDVFTTAIHDTSGIGVTNTTLPFLSTGSKNRMSIVLEVYQGGLFGSVVIILLLIVVISIIVNVCLLHKVNRHKKTSFFDESAPVRPKRRPSASYLDVDPTSIKKDDKSETDSVVYDEVRDFVPHLKPSPPAAKTSEYYTEIPLTTNSAYRTPASGIITKT